MLRAILPALAVAVLAAPLAAQRPERSSTPRTGEQPEELAPYVTYGAAVRTTLGARFDKAPGRLTVARYATGLRFHDPHESWAWSIGPHVRRYGYDFDGLHPFLFASPFAGPGSPWGNVDVQGLSADLWTRLGGSWSASAALGAEWAGESGTRLHEQSLRGIALVGYEVNEDLTLFGGVFHIQGIEEDFSFPILGFDWNFLEELGIVSDEEGTRLEFEPDPDWTIDLGFAGDALQARLGPRAAVPDGILQTFEVDLGLRVNWRPAEGQRVSLGVLGTAFHELELQSPTGAFLARDRLEPALVLFLHLDLRF